MITYKMTDYTEDNEYVTVTREKGKTALFFSGKTYQQLTGEAPGVAPGTYKTITEAGHQDNIWDFTDGLSEVSNPDTGTETGLTFGGTLEYNSLSDMSEPFAYVLNDKDYETLTVNEPDGNVSAVVPGSSWNGAIRSRAGEILSDFGVGNVTNILREWFGYVDEKERTAKQSQVYIRESLIRGGTELEMVRNKIDRFSGGMAEGSLYRERSYFEGDLELELRVKKTCPDWKALCGLLLLIAKDIENGYLPVGGQTAVGRGIFESGEEEKNVNMTEEQEYMHALAEFIIERRLG